MQILRDAKKLSFLTFVVALTFVIDASQMVQATEEDNDPAIASFKHCTETCRFQKPITGGNWLSRRFKYARNYVACTTRCDLQLEKTERKRHLYLHPYQLVLIHILFR